MERRAPGSAQGGRMVGIVMLREMGGEEPEMGGVDMGSGLCPDQYSIT